ncbi:MAG TPA: hypothetical protein VNE82_02195 [Candidatus Binataceae bacterium]|nr:hypothetical protein [Candidatus Binataceae bacterium]
MSRPSLRVARVAGSGADWVEQVWRAVVTVLERAGGAQLRRGACALLVGLLAAHGAANAQPPHPSRAAVVGLAFDAGTRTIFKATAENLYRSGDEGRTWTAVTLPPAAARGRIAAVAVSAGNKPALYVAGPGMGVLRSDDDGRAWTSRSKGLPSDNNIVALAAHAAQPGTVYVDVAGHGIFRSMDGGARWKLMDRGPRERIVRFIHTNMPGSMQTGWLFAATAKGVSRAMDCFCGWHSAGALGHAARAVAYDPSRPQDIYAATDDALFLSTNGGERWARINAPAPAVSALVVTPSGELYAGTGDGVLFRSADRGRTWKRTGA